MPHSLLNTRLLIPLLLAMSPLAFGEEEEPKIKELGNGDYKLGLISFNENTRKFSFPGNVNMVEGLLEFAIVEEKGKIHEALFSTKASPLQINIVLKLLRYQESPELFPIVDENFQSTGKFPEVSDEQKAAARLELLVSWQEGDERKEYSMNDLIYNTVIEKAMPPSPWLYQGSVFFEGGRFKAETSGDLVAIYITQTALFNFTGDSNDLDEVWIPNAKLMPPIGTPVTFTFGPLLKKS